MKNNKQSLYSNPLANETSPYLLQHAGNPVDWRPWSAEALQEAEKKDKMLLVSIGYSACHWCHVMEHESFEDEEVARIMNEHFICIKVDREEHPDVDKIYMTAVQLISGNGGWPLNCFALPDGSPVYGGTYFTRDQWVELLKYIANIYAHERSKATRQANSLKQGIEQHEFVSIKEGTIKFIPDDADRLFSSMVKDFDTTNGGFGGAPKFPMPVTWLFLLRYHHAVREQDSLEMVAKTLDRMAGSGIYDHLGGGFARYATRADWNIPHFEKMLYDNGQLVSLYSEAFQLTRKDLYKEVVYETIEFIGRELTSPEGVFYSSLDADSDGEEGKYYVWTTEELNELLGEDAAIFKEYYNCTIPGNWEDGKNNLYITQTIESIAKKHRMDREILNEKIHKAQKTLFHKRSERIKPGLDDKILTSWNAIMIKGLTDAYRVFNETWFLEMACRAASFLLKNQRLPDGKLMRNYKDGRSTIPAFLDDYALLSDACINLYKATFDEQWLDHATLLTEYTFAHFYDANTSMFYYTSDEQTDLVVRKMELSDNVIPASNSVVARNLHKLGIYLDNKQYTEIAAQMLTNLSKDMFRQTIYHANWGVLLLELINDPIELVISGGDAHNKRKELEQHYLPGILLAGSEGTSHLSLLMNRYHPDRTLIYVCRNRVCKYPVETIEDALKLIAH